MVNTLVRGNQARQGGNFHLFQKLDYFNIENDYVGAKRERPGHSVHINARRQYYSPKWHVGGD